MENLARVGVSITTLDAELKRAMEPQAASPAARLRVVRELTAAGVPTGGLVAPVIPALNDSEIERILDAAAHAGVKEASYVLLRLPLARLAEVLAQAAAVVGGDPGLMNLAAAFRRPGVGLYPATPPERFGALSEPGAPGIVNLSRPDDLVPGRVAERLVGLLEPRKTTR